MKVRVLRRFHGADGKDLVVGSVVDLEGRNIQKLIEQRYLEAVSVSDPAPVKPAKKG